MEKKTFFLDERKLPINNTISLKNFIYSFTWTPVPGSRKEARKRAASRYFMCKTLKHKNYAFDN
jgi:hypothetical protein